MTRKCKNKCGTELPPAAKCDDINDFLERLLKKKGYCSQGCATEAGNKKQKAAIDNKKAKEFKEMKDRVDSQGNKSKLMQRAQAAFNAFIRARDEKQSCISCETTKSFSGLTGSSWDAGHYRSRGACPELRFNEDNCFKQCVKCNRDDSGNVVNMRLGILTRIGEKRLAVVEGPHRPKKYTADELRDIATEYKAKLKALGN